MTKDNIHDKFNDLIGQSVFLSKKTEFCTTGVCRLTDDEFWVYIRSWKDEQDLCEQMNEWEEETKEEAIKELNELLAKRKK